MKRPALALLLALLPVALPAPAAETVRRFALVVGANAGGDDRPALKYAVSDARRFAAVLRSLGGVDEGDAVFLEQPGLHDLEKAFDALQRRTGEARRPGSPARSELVFYYSGHADEKGLLLGEDRYSYRTLRDRLDAVPVEVRIAVLDACASGAFTRLKGGQRRKPFLPDQPAEMRGHAFLTSSTASEVAQESDRIGGSYFTYFLVAALRGAADVSGRGTVTLNEAYGFAFRETLGETVSTRGGAQHPAYDINLSGTGDVVITDLRDASARLVLSEALDGRLYFKDARRQLVAELHKPAGQTVALALPPGAYQVFRRRGESTEVAQAKVSEGKPSVLSPGDFTATKPDPTLTRGAPVERLALAGRHSLGLNLGYWSTPSADPTSGTVHVGWDSTGFSTGFQFTHYLDESFAATVGFKYLGLGSSTVVTSQGTSSGTASLLAIPVGARWTPRTWLPARGTTRPYLAASLGPVIGVAAGTDVAGSTAQVGGHTETALGATLGGGVDFHAGRSWAFGVSAGYNLMTDFGRPVGGRSSYNGLELRASVAWVFGKGSDGGR